MMQGEEGVVIRGRVEIDTRQPFRSVKEAVMLFGEKILAGEVYGNKLKEMQSKASHGPKNPLKFGEVTAELQETKQSLQKAKEEGNLMAHCLHSLKQELEYTKRELHQLKAKSDKTIPNLDINVDEPEIHEEIKFIENTRKVDEMVIRTPEKESNEGNIKFQKKRSVKFANPPLLTKVIVSKDDCSSGEEGLKSKKKTKKKKKALGPLFGGLFLKNKGSKDGES